jgi:hypothetical protein
VAIDPQAAHHAAVQLADSLRRGTRLQARSPTIALGGGEEQLAGMPLMVGVYNQQNSQPGQLPFFVWGDATIIAASVLTAFAFGQSEQRRALAQNRPQWRIVDYGTLHVTSHRVAVQGSLAWQDIPLSDVRMFEQHEDGVVLHMAERSPGKLIVEGPGYLHVLLNHLAFGRVVDPVQPPPPLPPQLPPPAWHPDPSRRHQLRYWDGSTWTAHVADNGVASTDPLAN